MDLRLNVAGFETELTVDTRDLDEVYQPVLERLIEPGVKRRTAFVAGPPGSGKSTFAAILQALGRRLRDKEIIVLPMDGFHFSNAYLKTHSIEREGRQIPLAQIKGSPETFDVAKLTDALKSLHTGRALAWPVYDRRIHDVIPDGIQIRGDGIFLVEGNYLLLDEPGWRELSTFADFRIRLSASEDLLLRRLIDRQIRGGRDLETARAWVQRSDLANLRRTTTRQLPADMEVTERDGGYQLKDLSAE